MSWELDPRGVKRLFMNRPGRDCVDRARQRRIDRDLDTAIGSHARICRDGTGLNFRPLDRLNIHDDRRCAGIELSNCVFQRTHQIW